MFKKNIGLKATYFIYTASSQYNSFLIWPTYLSYLETFWFDDANRPLISIKTRLVKKENFSGVKN